jgi:hypothetical protein
VSDGGTLVLTNTTTVQGTLALDAFGDDTTLEIAGKVGLAGAVTFEGAGGRLILDTSQAFHGTVAGFAHQDAFDLTDIAFASGASWSFTEDGGGSQGVLKVKDGAGHVAKITLLGQYAAAGQTIKSASSTVFTVAADSSPVSGNTGTLITTSHL